MVAIPKIVLKAQTRMTLNDRFTVYGEQVQGRQQMQREDLETRRAEDSLRSSNNGAANSETAELSKKLSDLQRVIESQMYKKDRRGNFVPPSIASSVSPPRRKRYSPVPSRPLRHDGVVEVPIIPEYRQLTYETRGRRAGGYDVPEPRRARKELTYGDLITGQPSTSAASSFYHQSSHSVMYSDQDDNPRAKYYRNPAPYNNSSNNIANNSRFPNGRSPSLDRYQNGAFAPFRQRPHNNMKKSPYRQQPQWQTYKEPYRPEEERYRHPLMRDSESEQGEDDDDDDPIEHSGRYQRPMRYSPRPMVRSRLGFQKGRGWSSFNPVRGLRGFGNARRFRGKGSWKNFSGNQKMGGRFSGGPNYNAGFPRHNYVRGHSNPRGGRRGGGRGGYQKPIITKEQLDKELDEYKNRKGLGENMETIRFINDLKLEDTM